jgi:hypothetical protein
MIDSLRRRGFRFWIMVDVRPLQLTFIYEMIIIIKAFGFRTTPDFSWELAVFLIILPGWE